MIAELPLDIQGHVWDLYTVGLHARVEERHRRVAVTALEHILFLCNNDAAACNFLWMAHMLRHPLIKPAKAPDMLSEISAATLRNAHTRVGTFAGGSLN